MSLFNALFSTALFKASQDKFNRDKKKAQQTAYDNVGISNILQINLFVNSFGKNIF